MKFTPILFNTPMVQAILNTVSPKTKTRRLNGLEDINESPDEWSLLQGTDDFSFVHKNGKKILIKCPYGDVGDILWVRETWAGDDLTGFIYKADHPNANLMSGDLDDGEVQIRKWKPNIHMPKIAARIFCEVVSIHPEKLSVITESDAMAEGVIMFLDVSGPEVKVTFKDYLGISPGLPNPIDSFNSLWQSTYGIESLKSDPWLWVVEFKQIEIPQNWNY